MVYESTFAIRKRLRMSADAPFFFEELNRFVSGMELLIELVNTVFAVFKARSTAKLVVNLCIGDNKSGSFLGFRFCYGFFLFFYGGEG